MKNNLKRRNFLKSLLLTLPAGALQTSPFVALLESLINNAYGMEEDFKKENCYVGILLRGGPPRWMFDLPLRPNGNDVFTENPMLATGIVNDKLTYKTVNIGGIFMPLLWDKTIPTLDTGDVKLNSLLNNMIMLRGYNLGIDGHSTNQIRHFRPNQSYPSIDGAATRESSRPVPNVAISRSLGFFSESGKSQITIGSNDSNPLNTILSNFRLSSGRNPASISTQELEESIEQVLYAIESKANKDNISLKSSFENRLNAKNLFKKSFGNLKEYYDQRVAEYDNLQIKTFTDSRYNLGLEIQNHSLFEKTGNNGMNDLFYRITGFGGDEIPVSPFDLRNTLQERTRVANLSHSFCILEFLLKEKLTSGITIDLGSLIRLKKSETINFNSSNDSHRTGAIANLFLFSKYYQAFSAGLYELRRFLKDNNLFDQTLLQISGDFNRNSKTNGSGSDHGWQGSNTTLFSGMIEKHQIAGNIKAQTNGNHKGTWGMAAGVDALDGQDMTFGNVASSISGMLGVNTPSPNSPSLIKKNDRNKVELINNLGAKNV